MRSQKSRKRLLADMDIAMVREDIATNLATNLKGPFGALSH
jgi:hypothetical protein